MKHFVKNNYQNLIWSSSLQMMIFHCWDFLWGSDKIALHSRHEKGQVFVNLTADLDFQLFFPQETIIYMGTTRLEHVASTIDLAFSSTCLAKNWILCTLLETDYRSDHTAIEIVFIMTNPESLFHHHIGFLKGVLGTKSAK